MADQTTQPTQTAGKKQAWERVKLNVIITNKPRRSKQVDKSGVAKTYYPCAIRGQQSGWVEIQARGSVASTLQTLGASKGYSMTVTGVKIPTHKEGQDPAVIAYSVSNIRSPQQRKQLQNKHQQNAQTR